jgi:hypothetical protein
VLLDSIRYYTLLRLHQFIPGQSNELLSLVIHFAKPML